MSSHFVGSKPNIVPVARASTCNGGNPAEGASLLQSFVDDLNDLGAYLKLASYCLNNFDCIIRTAKRENSTPADKLLAAIALVMKGEKETGIIKQNLLNQAEIFMEKIPPSFRADTVNLFKGILHFQKGDWEKAEGSFKKALSNNPTSYLANYHLMVMALVHGDFGTALNYSQKIPGENLSDTHFRKLFPELSIYKARIYLNLYPLTGVKLTDEAVREIETSPYLDKNSTNYKILQAEIQYDKGNFTRAVEILGNIAASGKNIVYVRFLLGMFYQKITNYKKAYEHYKKAVDLSQNPACGPIDREYGRMAGKKIGEIREIIKILTPLLKEPQRTLPQIPDPKGPRMPGI